MPELRKVGMEQFNLSQKRYQLVSGDVDGAPLCPYGNHFEWIGYDIEEKQFVRFTKSVFKLLVNLPK